MSPCLWAKWCGLAIRLLLSLNCCLWSGKQISLNTCWQSDDLLLLNSRWRFGDILSLSSTNRICSFNWIRGSEHFLLTSFSNLYCYFLSLVFFRICYLLVSLHLSRLRGNPISHPIFIRFVLQIPRCTCTRIFLAHITHILKVRRSWEPGTRISTSILCPFCLSAKVSHANVC